MRCSSFRCSVVPLSRRSPLLRVGEVVQRGAARLGLGAVLPHPLRDGGAAPPATGPAPGASDEAANLAVGDGALPWKPPIAITGFPVASWYPAEFCEPTASIFRRR